LTHNNNVVKSANPTQWIESSQRRRNRQCRRVMGYGNEEAHETVASADERGGGVGEGANATAGPVQVESSLPIA
jgi:hypothetical protein